MNKNTSKNALGNKWKLSSGYDTVNNDYTLMSDTLMNDLLVKSKSKCPCGDIFCTIGQVPIMPVMDSQSFKNESNKVDISFEQFSKKDLIGAIYALLEEYGGTGTKIPQTGASFLLKDIIVQNGIGLPYIAFRSLVDAQQEESE